MKYFFYLLIPFIVACQSFKNKLPLQQGIKGKVLLAAGNLMPGPGKRSGTSKQTKAILYIYEPTTANQAVGAMPDFSKITSKLYTIVKTNSAGEYAVHLPPGKYSVFIKDDEGFFANESDGSGVINPVEVAAAHVTERNWTLGRNAVY